MKHKCQGIALIIVLIFLQILSLLGLFAIQLAWLETKQSHNLWQRHEMQAWAYKAIRQAEQEAGSNPRCQIPVTSTEQLLTHLPYPQSCTGNFNSFKYYYIFEFLGTDPCTIVQSLPTPIAANYFRVTLLGVVDDIKIVLQSTITIPNFAEQPTHCEGISHIAPLGQQMWREITTTDYL